MPPFMVPLWWNVFDPDPTGPIRRVIQARLEGLRVETDSGDFRVFPRAIVDTGASVTVMSAVRARELGIPFPAETSRLPMTTAAGRVPADVHDGQLRLRFPELGDRVVRLYCVFSEAVPPTVPPLLGLHDLLDVFRLTFDGRPQPGALMGTMRFDPAT